MEKKRLRVRMTLFDILVEIIALVLLTVFLFSLQTSLSVSRQTANSATKLQIALDRMERNGQEAAANRESYDAFSQAKVDTLAYFFERNPEYAGDFDAMAEQWGLDEMLLLDASGKALQSHGDGAALENGALEQLSGDAGAARIGEMYYYQCALADGRKLVGGRDSAEKAADFETLESPANALKTIRVGTGGFMIAVSLADQTIAYHPDEAKIGMPAADIGLSGVALEDGYTGWVKIDGARNYCETALCGGEYAFIATVTQGEMRDTGMGCVIAALIVFVVIITLIVAYAALLRGDASRREELQNDFIPLGKRLYFNRAISHKVRNLLVLGLVAIVGVTWYAESLVVLTRYAGITDRKLDDIVEILDDNDERIASLQAEYDEEYGRRAQNLAYLIKEDPTLADNDCLTEVALRLQVRDIYVMNRSGRTVATNTVYTDFVLSTVEGDQSYDFWNVIKGYKDVLVQAAQEDDSAEHQMLQYVGAERLDAPGMVQIGVRPARLKSRLAATEISYVLSSIAVENGGILYALNGADRTFAAAPEKRWIGKSAEELGLREVAFTDGYSGYQTLDSTQMFINCRAKGDLLLYVALPVERIMADAPKTALAVGGASLVAMLALAAFLLIYKKDTVDKMEKWRAEEIRIAEAAKASGDVRKGRSFFHVMFNGRERVTQSAASRWAKESSAPWSECSPEQKLGRIVMGLLGVCAAALVAYIVTHKDGYDRASILSYILNQRWERVPSLFSFSYIAMSLVEIFVITWVVRKLLVVILQNFGTRIETVGRMLDSFIKYAAVLGGLLYCLQFLGMDSSTILASAGILTLVIGLGAQSLVKDILAGLFIVFEGEFRVGDIVTVNGYIGSVEEIGIRTTKIMDASQNIKIFNNSDISGVVNMTKQYSLATCTYGLQYGDSLEQMEEVLRKELPILGEQNRGVIISGPFYQGISEVTSAGVKITIAAQCMEANRIDVMRLLNREFKLLCDRNGIKLS